MSTGLGKKQKSDDANLQILVYLIGEIGEEFKCILLFPDVDLLTVQFEGFPERSGNVILQFGIM